VLSALWNRPPLLHFATSALPLFGVLLVATTGCREQPTTVSGSVTLDGQPLKVTSDSRGTVVFQPLGGVGTVATGLINASGNFELATGSSNEVAPGNYFVAISVARLTPKTDQTEPSTQLVTPAKYSSARDSGLQTKVQPGANHVKFELNSNANGNEANSTRPNDSSPPADVHTPDDAKDAPKR
jgi:hypothetical protein